MQVLRRSESSVSVMIEGTDDLWYLQNVIHPGDKISTIVHRRAEKQDDMNRSKETSRKPVKITALVEKLEFQAFSNRIRILGKIVGGPEEIIGEHQSAIIEKESVLDIIKESWYSSERKMFKEAIESRSRVTAVFTVLDDDEASIFILRSYGLQQMGHIESGRSGKSYQTDYDEKTYLESLAETLKNVVESSIPLIVLGPGFTRDHFVDFLRNKPDFSGLNITSFAASRTDDQAVYEFLASSEAQKTVRESRLAAEKKVMEEFLKGVGQGNMSTYGTMEVDKAVDMGAVSDLLVTEEKSRSEEVVHTLEKATNTGGKVHILSSHSDPGKVLKGFGGVAAILRYPIQ